MLRVTEKSVTSCEIEQSVPLHRGISDTRTRHRYSLPLLVTNVAPYCPYLHLFYAILIEEPKHYLYNHYFPMTTLYQLPGLVDYVKGEVICYIFICGRGNFATQAVLVNPCLRYSLP